MADQQEFTVEQLAAAAGTMTTTVRMYQARGLLPAPERRGRIAVYGDRHLRRLRHIAELQQRGHSLAGIKELLDGVAEGRGLSDLVGVITVGEPELLRLAPGDLAARFRSGLAPNDVERAMSLGLLEVDGADAIVDARFLEVGAALADLGVPVAVVLDEWELLQADVAGIAKRFTALFERHLWPSLAEGASLEETGTLLGHLGPLALRVTSLALEGALADEAGQFLAVHADT